MAIIWFNEKPKEGVVTIAQGHLTLNKPATTFFESAYSVMLGIDPDDKKVIIKPLDKATALRHDIPDTKKYRITVRSSYSRITNKAFVEELTGLFNLDFKNETIKFPAEWDNKQKVLVINMKEEIKWTKF